MRIFYKIYLYTARCEYALSMVMLHDSCETKKFKAHFEANQFSVIKFHWKYIFGQ